MTRGQQEINPKTGIYYLPDHASEQTRLNFQHEMVRMILDGKLGLAPVQNPTNVLDIATGTGIWAIQYGEEHPESRVLGIDLGMPKPTSYPSNCEFLHHDAEYDPWNFPRLFDYVHLGHVVSCFDDTTTVMKRIYNNLTPGGWVEFHDSGTHTTAFNDSVEGSAIEEWARATIKGARSVGRDVTKSRQYVSWLREAGFVNIGEIREPLPSNGAWPRNAKDKKIGAMYSQVLRSLIEALTRFLMLAGLSAEEAKDLESRAKSDALDPNIHIAFPFHIIYAQKPLSER